MLRNVITDVHRQASQERAEFPKETLCQRLPFEPFQCLFLFVNLLTYSGNSKSKLPGYLLFVCQCNSTLKFKSCVLPNNDWMLHKSKIYTYIVIHTYI